MTPSKEGGIKVCYNVQTAVGAKSHLIANYEMTSNPSDRGTLNRCMERVFLLGYKDAEIAEAFQNSLNVSGGELCPERKKLDKTSVFYHHVLPGKARHQLGKVGLVRPRRATHPPPQRGQRARPPASNINS